MLRSAALRFFVGASNPPGLPGVAHLPGADLRTIADAVLRRWGGCSDRPVE
jgi:hypothetical protein